MATFTIYGNTGDMMIESNGGNSYAAARAGTGTKTVQAQPMGIGQYFSTPNYFVWNSFIHFDTSGVASATDVTLTMSTFNTQHSPSFTVEARLYDWGGTVEAADYIPADNLGNYPLMATASTAGWTQGTVTVVVPFTSESTFKSSLNFGGMTRLVLASDRARLGTTPTGDESFTFFGTANTGTTDDPRLTITTAGPSFVLSTRVAALSTSTSAATGTFSVVAGDVIVAWAMSKDGGASVPITVSDNIGGGTAAYTKQTEINVDSSTPYVAIYTRTVTTTASFISLSFNRAASGPEWTVGLQLWRGVSAIGAVGNRRVQFAAPSIDITTQADNSALVLIDMDRLGIDTNATTDYVPVGYPVANNASMPRVLSGSYGFFAVHYDSTGTAGAKTFGMGYPGGQDYSMAVLELLSVSYPTVTAELWENGVLKQSLGSTQVTADGVFSFAWDAATLTALSGADVELRLTSDLDLDVGAIEWNLYRTPTAPTIALVGSSAGLSTVGGTVVVGHPLAALSAGISTVLADLGTVSGYREAWGMVLI